MPEDQIAELVRKHFPLTPRGIIKHLDLLRPIYKADRPPRPLRPRARHERRVHLGEDRQGRRPRPGGGGQAEECGKIRRGDGATAPPGPTRPGSRQARASEARASLSRACSHPRRTLSSSAHGRVRLGIAARVGDGAAAHRRGRRSSRTGGTSGSSAAPTGRAARRAGHAHRRAGPRDQEPALDRPAQPPAAPRRPRPRRPRLRPRPQPPRHRAEGNQPPARHPRRLPPLRRQARAGPAAGRS